MLVATYAFAFQIYGDFAGYSNMARGISKLLGIELNINFRFPYFVRRRTNSGTLANQFFNLAAGLPLLPLGGSRGSEIATQRNLMITMVLGGLWHGADWRFVLWGAYQGLALVVARGIERWSAARSIAVAPGLNWRRVVLTIIMFHVTCYGWLIFRAESVSQVSDLTRRVAVDLLPTLLTLPAVLAAIVPIVGPLMVVHAYQARRDSESAPLQLVPPVRYALYAGVFYLVLLFGSFEGAQFISLHF